LDAALDLEELATTKYSGGYFFEEMQGMADATGIDVKVKIFRIKLNIRTKFIFHRNLKESICWVN
jgi:hypothetical protein